jgi:hypothetical protein
VCYDCWARAGKPADLPPGYGLFAELVADLYDHDSVGGPLHAVLDDWNLSGNVAPWPGLCYEGPDGEDITGAVYRLCHQIATMLNEMAEPQRYAALARVGGFVI